MVDYERFRESLHQFAAAVWQELQRFMSQLRELIEQIKPYLMRLEAEPRLRTKQRKPDTRAWRNAVAAATRYSAPSRRVIAVARSRC